MESVQHLKDQNTVIVPLKSYERMQREILKLRKKLRKEKLLRELRDSIISVETDIRNGVKPKGRGAREFIAELMNEK